MKKLILSFIALCLVSYAANAEEVYDRVMKSQTIRCGYMVGAPYIIKDPKTGAITGIWHDYMEELGKALSLNIEWSEEIGHADFAEALNSGKVDAICMGVWVNPARARVADFVTPITYQILHAYGRFDDTRFDNNLQRINDESVSISCMDGEMSAMIAHEDYPKAKTACLPQLSQFSDLYMNVAQKKADVIFASPASVKDYNEANTVKLREIPNAYPVRIFPESVAIAYGQSDFRQMLDRVTEFLINTGKIDSIIARYAAPGDFQRPIKPYEVSK